MVGMLLWQAEIWCIRHIYFLLGGFFAFKMSLCDFRSGAALGLGKESECVRTRDYFSYSN